MGKSPSIAGEKGRQKQTGIAAATTGPVYQSQSHINADSVLEPFVHAPRAYHPAKTAKGVLAPPLGLRSNLQTVRIRRIFVESNRIELILLKFEVQLNFLYKV